ncbi:hypothetical protein FOC1_g10016144 [Fusarium oxysporum f. sp. cubense race 1]|uniref:Uncharacterized protein n=1 Tax=Fusarium oxysporum f. sp. cubense (strain race 1) TaxID=1229664 RepID=N4TUN1_FUSC1|nr:hypothetical protein FOC1_g10016144 [Fusarium oxysporum f. sp. cubense race 1]
MSENIPKDRNGSGSHDQSSSLSRGSMEEVPDMALDKTINKDDPAADHTSSSSRSSETSEKSLRDEGYPSAQDEDEEPVDEEPYSSYVHEENYGKEEDYEQEQDHGHDPTASAHSSPDSIVTMIANDHLFAIDFTVYHTD